MKAFDRELIVAVHEAGHAVACHRLGVPYRQVLIDKAGEDAIGTAAGAGVDTEAASRPKGGSAGTTEDVVRLETYATRCRAQVIVAFAGPIAEVRAARCGLTPAVGLNSGRKDERDAHFFVREMIQAKCDIATARGEPAIALEELPQMLVAELGVLHREAEALVEADFAAIGIVARRLAEAGQLSAADVAALIG